MKKIIKELYKFNRCLLGEGIDNALHFIDHLIGLDIIEIPSGTEVGTWKVPDEWIVKDAWIKYNGRKILDYKKEPLCLVVGSTPFKGKVKLKELQKHLHISDEMPDATPYEYNLYGKDWGFCIPRSQIKKKIKEACEGGKCMPELKKLDKTVGKVQIEGVDYGPKYKNTMKKGDYEVFIDTEYRPGTLKIGVHTIKGGDREILLIAHLDHPYQANDNLSGVACLVDLAKKIEHHNETHLEDKCKHTIKIIFCPETIGSIAYAFTQDISKVDFMIAVDSIGNEFDDKGKDSTILLQRAFDRKCRLNSVVHTAITGQGMSYRMGEFRLLIGSDEYSFNDPEIGIPGIMISRFPYKEYHTSADVPEIIKTKKIKEVQDLIIKIIEMMEKDFIPVRTFKGPLMRSRYDTQTPHKLLNRDLDYLIYDIDGKTYLSDLVEGLGVGFDYAYDFLLKLEKEGLISRK